MPGQNKRNSESEDEGDRVAKKQEDESVLSEGVSKLSDKVP